MIKKSNMLIKPKYDFEIESYFYRNFKTYSEYNYLNYGLGSNLKRMHLEKALELTREYFYKANVIDFGCADGVLLPSLSKYFNKVVGVDINQNFVKISQNLVNNMQLENVNVI